MNCKVCGAESGKYPLCMECNTKKETGEIIKCPKCQKWHYANMPCGEEEETTEKNGRFLYELKPSLVSKNEMEYLKCIKEVLPEGCLIQAQANLASFISRTDGARFQNELYRNVDFIVTDLNYSPLFLIEINDQSHLKKERQERDKKVADICEEAGIPVIKMWTSYGVNTEYIKKRINETLSALPVKRIHHFSDGKPSASAVSNQTQKGRKEGCYIATCVYSSYDCPQVWTLRRFRDESLRKSRIGCVLVKIYYGASPTLVRLFGNSESFRAFCKKCLDLLVIRLQDKGIKNTPYVDRK